MGRATTKMDLPMTTEKATESAGWILTSLGVITSTSIEEWALALATTVAGVSILVLNVVLRIRKAIRDEEIAGLKHEIERLHLRAEEKAEQSREAWARVKVETTALKDEVKALKASSSTSIPVYPSVVEPAQPGSGDPK